MKNINFNLKYEKLKKHKLNFKKLFIFYYFSLFFILAINFDFLKLNNNSFGKLFKI